eukprot:3372833-Pyramimonas_sp.AAC.1
MRAAVYVAIRAFYRVVLANIAPLCMWRFLWAQRRRHTFGPFTLLDRACRHSPRAACLAEADRRDPPRLRNAARVDDRPRDLRVFQRRCLAEREAARRPKDFGGLHQGLSEVREARKHMSCAQLHCGGPGLTAGGIWATPSNARTPNRDGDEICVRCKGAVETATQ